ncbi:ATP-binding cassette domain-containing protein [Kitasatospora sp. NPDC094015]|uniref:ATP-binding cassette domain-containing protein n=1 Tax=Kitasatospora sp. NPDC094015 TaxID=3155205 RepID=UPI00331FFD7A
MPEQHEHGETGVHSGRSAHDAHLGSTSDRPEPAAGTDPITDPATAPDPTADPGAAPDTGPTPDTGPASDGESLRLQFPADRRLRSQQSLSVLAMSRRLPQLVRRAFALAWRVDRLATVLLLVLQALSGLLGALALVATTETIRLVAAGRIADHLGEAAPSLAVLGLATGLRALFGVAITGLSERLAPRIGREGELTLLEAATSAELAAYDTPGYNDKWDAADRGADVSKDLIGDAQNLISSAVSLLTAASVLTVLHPLLLPFLLAASIPSGVAAVRAAQVHYLGMMETLEDRRLLGLLRWFLVDKTTADQVRSDTVAGFLLGRYRAAGTRIDRTTDRAAWRSARISLVGAVAAGLASLTVWVVLAWLLTSGRMSVASAGTAVIGLRTAATGLQGIVGFGARLYRLGLYLDDWAEFVELAGGHRIDRGTIRPAGPELVEVRDLSYTYPGADRPALDGVSLTLARGEIVALIGENGCGKTTLMKCLAALNLPHGGEVLWDGVPTRALDAQAAWRRTAVVPQEFARWPLTARDNIQLGQSLRGGDEAVLAAAARSGADEVIGGLRSGLDTLLAREWWGGVELSSGQWQRIAVARALHREAGLLVLDEPTSDLDARVEHRIFHSLRGLAESRAVILVTHNLINAAVADRIVVMRAGRIVQTGSYDRLITEPGLFRELWLLQRDRGQVPAQRATGRD